MKPIKDIYHLLQNNPQKILITMHQKPDGDALGSTLGLYHILLQLGHDVTVVSPTNWPNFLNWMPGIKTVIDFESKTEKAETIIKDVQIIFCLDFNTTSRLKKMEDIVNDVNCIKVLIDHHQEPDIAFFDYGISDTEKSSTCEMVYDFIMDSPFVHLINLDIATNLYTGLMTDTGSFKFPATKPSSHKMAAHLLQLGVVPQEINSAVFDNNSENRLKFLGFILLNRMEIDYELNYGIIHVTQKDLIDYDIKTGDTEGMVNFPLSIEGIKLSFIVIDRGEERKSSLRSKGDIDVNEFARKYFNGGGHKNAAGGRNFEPIEDVVNLFKTNVIELKNQLCDYNF